MSNAQPMAVMQRPPSAEEVAFARSRDRAVFAMDVLRLEPTARIESLRATAIWVLNAYLERA